MEIGKYEVGNSSPTLDFEFAFDTADFHKEWVRCSMLANYVAGYASYQFVRREWAENLISTVTNDFLEAIIRLSPDDKELFLHFSLYEGNLLLEVWHGLRTEMEQAYQSFLTDACTKDTDALYFQLLTATERPSPAFNQLGLMMLIHDFGVRLAAQLDKAGGTTRTRVFIPTKELVE